MSIGGVHHLGVEVQDLLKMEEFYIRVLGFVREYAYTSRNTPGLRTVFLRGPGITLELLERPENRGKPSGKGSFHLAFESADPDGEYRRLLALGLEVKPPRNTGDGYRELSLEDPEGNLIEVGCRVAPPPGREFS